MLLKHDGCDIYKTYLKPRNKTVTSALKHKMDTPIFLGQKWNTEFLFATSWPP